MFQSEVFAVMVVDSKVAIRAISHKHCSKPCFCTMCGQSAADQWLENSITAHLTRRGRGGREVKSCQNMECFRYFDFEVMQKKVCIWLKFEVWPKGDLHLSTVIENPPWIKNCQRVQQQFPGSFRDRQKIQGIFLTPPMIDQVISDEASSDHVINEFCGMDCDNYPEATSYNNYCGWEVILMRPQHDLPLLGRKQEQTAPIKDRIC